VGKRREADAGEAGNSKKRTQCKRLVPGTRNHRLGLGFIIEMWVHGDQQSRDVRYDAETRKPCTWLE
jgi:hypothetical protein